MANFDSSIPALFITPTTPSSFMSRIAARAMLAGQLLVLCGLMVLSGCGGGLFGALTTTLAAPTSLTGTGGVAQVVLNWTGSSGATTYNVYYSTTSGVTPATGTKIAAVTGTTYTLSSLTNGTTYYFVVTAVNTSSESTASNQASATPTALVVAPAAPTLTATAGNAQVVLSWATISGATSYNLYYSTTTGVTAATGTKISGLTGTTYTQTGLTNGTTYYYVLTAVGTGGESVASAQASAKPLAVVPAAPTALTAAAGNAQVALSWTASSGAVSYNVYYATTSGVTAATGTKISGITGTTYTQTGLTNGTTYYYIVTAVNTGGESVGSNQASATPTASLTAPVLSATAGNGQVALSWTAASGATAYNLYYSTSSTVTIATATKVGSISGTTYTLTGLSNCTTYYFAVTATSGSTESALSNQVSASPVSATTITLTPGTAASLTLAANATTSLTFNFPANAVSQSATVSLTSITQAALTTPFTQTVQSFVTGVNVCIVPSTISTFNAPVTLSGTVASTYTSGTQLNLAALSGGTYADTATLLVGTAGALQQSAPTVKLPGLTTSGTFVLYQPAAGTNTSALNLGIVVLADDGAGMSDGSNGLQIIHIYDTSGNLLPTPTIQLLDIASAFDLDGQALTPDGSVGAVVDGSNKVRFFTGLQTGTPKLSTTTLDITAYGGDGDSIATLPNGDESIVSGDNGQPLAYISGILSGSPVIASTVPQATGASNRDGLVISNDGKVMLSRGYDGLTVYSIASITPTAGTLAGTVSHSFAITKNYETATSSISVPYLEDGRDGMALSPADSTRAVVVGTTSAYAPIIQLLTGLPAAPVLSTAVALPSTATAVYGAAIAPNGKLAIVSTSAGLILFSGVDTGTLVQVGAPYAPTLTIGGVATVLNDASTLGITLDGKYVVAGYNNSYGLLVVFPFSATGFSAPASYLGSPTSNIIAIPYNDQLVIR